jgi:hypothetical protein
MMLTFVLHPCAVEFPTAFTAAITAQMIRTNITAYSEAVVASSSRQKALRSERCIKAFSDRWARSSRRRRRVRRDGRDRQRAAEGSGSSFQP